MHVNLLKYLYTYAFDFDYKLIPIPVTPSNIHQSLYSGWNVVLIMISS